MHYVGHWGIGSKWSKRNNLQLVYSKSLRVRYHLPPFEEHVLAPQNNFGRSGRIGKNTLREAPGKDNACSYILKAGFAGFQNPQTIWNFPQKDCLRTRKMSILQYVRNKGEEASSKTKVCRKVLHKM